MSKIGSRSYAVDPATRTNGSSRRFSFKLN